MLKRLGFTHRILGVFTLCFVLNCSPPPTLKGYYPDGKLRYEIAHKDGKNEGKELWYYSSGVKKWEQNNREGKRQGFFQGWFVNGQLMVEGNDSLGVPEGYYKYYYENGKIQSELNYRSGILLNRKDWDSLGRVLFPLPTPSDSTRLVTEKSNLERNPPAPDSLKIRDSLRLLLKPWIRRVQSTVETYWRAPRFKEGTIYKAIANFSIDKQGNLVSLNLAKKSGRPNFDKAITDTFKKITRFPTPPKNYPKDTLEIQYEFISKGVDRK